MPLSQEQRDYLTKLCNELSIDSLLQLKKGNIKGIKDFDTKLIDPLLIIEHEEMKEILKECSRRRNM